MTFHRILRNKEGFLGSSPEISGNGDCLGLRNGSQGYCRIKLNKEKLSIPDVPIEAERLTKAALLLSNEGHRGGLQ